MKRPKIDDDLSRMIQDYANKNTDGNFTKAVDILIRSALLSWLTIKTKIGDNDENVHSSNADNS